MKYFRKIYFIFVFRVNLVFDNSIPVWDRIRWLCDTF